MPLAHPALTERRGALGKPPVAQQRPRHAAAAQEDAVQAVLTGRRKGYKPAAGRFVQSRHVKRGVEDDAAGGRIDAGNRANLRQNGLRRSATDQWIGGVCGGLSAFTGLDTWLWRLVFALMLILGGTGLVLYVLLWILVPLETVTRTESARS